MNQKIAGLYRLAVERGITTNLQQAGVLKSPHDLSPASRAANAVLIASSVELDDEPPSPPDSGEDDVLAAMAANSLAAAEVVLMLKRIERHLNMMVRNFSSLIGIAESYTDGMGGINAISGLYADFSQEPFPTLHGIPNTPYQYRTIPGSGDVVVGDVNVPALAGDVDYGQTAWSRSHVVGQGRGIPDGLVRSGLPDHYTVSPVSAGINPTHHMEAIFHTWMPDQALAHTLEALANIQPITDDDDVLSWTQQTAALVEHAAALRHVIHRDVLLFGEDILYNDFEPKSEMLRNITVIGECTSLTDMATSPRTSGLISLILTDKAKAVLA